MEEGNLMHQPKNFKTSLTRAGLSIRAFFLSILLVGSVLTCISAFVSEQVVFAQGSPKMSTHHLTSIRPLAVTSPKKPLQLKGRLAPQASKAKKGLTKQNQATLNTSNVALAVAAVDTPTVTPTDTPTDTPTVTPTDTPTDTPTVTPTDTPTDTPTVTPTDTPTVTPTVIPPTPPALAIVKTNLGGDTFTAGDHVTFIIVVSDLSTGGPVVAPDAISVSDVIPLGLKDIHVEDPPQWSFSLSDTTSPVIINANYIGLFPVLPGEVLAPIVVTGTLTGGAVPLVTTTTTVSIDPLGLSNSATDTIFVQKNSNNNNNNDNHNNDNHNNDHNNNNDSNNNNDGDNDNDNNHHNHHNNNGDHGSSGSSGSSGSDGSGSSGSGGSGSSGSDGSSVPTLPGTGGGPLKC
jgi:uncharacterized membrane protein YgcG